MQYNKYLQATDIVVLGEQSLFVITEHQGKIRYQKRFIFSPVCMINFHLRRNGEDIYVDDGEDLNEIIDSAASKSFDKGGLKTPGFMTMLASFEGYLMIYKDT